MIKIFKLLLTNLLLATTIFAQIGEVTIKIEAINLKPQEKTDLETLTSQIKSYLEDFEWTENKYGIAIPLRVNIYAQKATISSSERKFTGQFIIVSESNDFQLFEKKMVFKFARNEALMHDTEIKSLPSILDYYAYVMLAAEYDTYDLLGGATLFEKARSIASRAEMSSYSSGWVERSETLNDIIELRYFRKFKYYFWSVYDLESNEDIDAIPESIEKALFNLEEELKVNTRSRYVRLFLDAHTQDLGDILKVYGTSEQRAQILELDQDNAKTYKKIFMK